MALNGLPDEKSGRPSLTSFILLTCTSFAGIEEKGSEANIFKNKGIRACKGQEPLIQTFYRGKGQFLSLVGPTHRDVTFVTNLTSLQ